MRTRILIERADVNPGFAVDDRIFLGEGLFETLKVESSKPCFAFLHWQRLANSAFQLGIPFDLSFDDWLECLVQQIRQDNLYSGGIKAILSGGSAPRGLAEQSHMSHLMLQTFNYTVSNQPVWIVSVSWLRDGDNPVYQHKSVNYLEAILARRQALGRGADDALFFNSRLHATETTCANLFIIKNNELFTPTLSDGVLPGITRSRILSSCVEQQISCTECSITRSMIKEADGVFITNSLQGIRPVRAIDDVDFEVIHPLMDHFSFV